MEKKNADLCYALDRKGILLLILYAWGALLVLSVITGQNVLNGLRLFESSGGYSLVGFLLDMIIYGAGAFAVFIVPGLVWGFGFFNRSIRLSGLLFHSFLISFVMFFVLTALYKIFVPTEMNSQVFSRMVIFMTVSGMVWLMAPKKTSEHSVNLAKAHLVVCLVLSGLAMIGIWVFQDKVLWVSFNHNYSPAYILSLPLGALDDLTEHFGLVDSLKQHLLPYWDLEYADRFGYSVIDPPFHTIASSFLTLFLGMTFGVQSLSTVIAVIVSYILVLKISEDGADGRPRTLIRCLVPFLFLCYFAVILSHFDSAVVLCDHIHFMTFFSVAQLYFLSRKKSQLFLVFALLAFLTKYEAAMFTLLALGFYRIIFRTGTGETRRLLGRYLCLLLPYIILIAVIGFQRQDLGVYVESLFIERFMRLDYIGILDKIYPQSQQLWGPFSISETMTFIMQFLLATGLIGTFMFLPQKDNISRFYKGVGVVYFIVVLLSREKRLHYISPLVFLSVVVALRSFARMPCGRIEGKEIHDAV